jgi:hypothetical protein
MTQWSTREESHIAAQRRQFVGRPSKRSPKGRLLRQMLMTLSSSRMMYCCFSSLTNVPNRFIKIQPGQQTVLVVGLAMPWFEHEISQLKNQSDQLVFHLPKASADRMVCKVKIHRKPSILITIEVLPRYLILPQAFHTRVCIQDPILLPFGRRMDSRKMCHVHELLINNPLLVDNIPLHIVIGL